MDCCTPVRQSFVCGDLITLTAESDFNKGETVIPYTP